MSAYRRPWVLDEPTAPRGGDWPRWKRSALLSLVIGPLLALCIWFDTQLMLVMGGTTLACFVVLASVSWATSFLTGDRERIADLEADQAQYKADIERLQLACDRYAQKAKRLE